MGNGMPNLEPEGFLKSPVQPNPGVHCPPAFMASTRVSVGSENRWSPELRARPIAYCALAAGLTAVSQGYPPSLQQMGAQLEMSCNLANRAAAVNHSHGRNLQITTVHSPGPNPYTSAFNICNP